MSLLKKLFSTALLSASLICQGQQEVNFSNSEFIPLKTEVEQVTSTKRFPAETTNEIFSAKLTKEGANYIFTYRLNGQDTVFPQSLKPESGYLWIAFPRTEVEIRLGKQKSKFLVNGTETEYELSQKGSGSINDKVLEKSDQALTHFLGLWYQTGKNIGEQISSHEKKAEKENIYPQLPEGYSLIRIEPGQSTRNLGIGAIEKERNLEFGLNYLTKSDSPVYLFARLASESPERNGARLESRAEFKTTISRKQESILEPLKGGWLFEGNKIYNILPGGSGGEIEFYRSGIKGEKKKIRIETGPEKPNIITCSLNGETNTIIRIGNASQENWQEAKRRIEEYMQKYTNRLEIRINNEFEKMKREKTISPEDWNRWLKEITSKEQNKRKTTSEEIRQLLERGGIKIPEDEKTPDQLYEEIVIEGK